MTLALKAVNNSIYPELVPPINNYVSNYKQAVSLAEDILWEELQKHTVGEALELWLATLSPLTAKNYRSAMSMLETCSLLEPETTLQRFAVVNHNAIIDRIKKDVILTTNGKTWSECSRQARSACYISFTGFLSRRSQGMIKKAVPCKEGNAKTFFRVYSKVKTSAMTQSQWIAFFDALEQINQRDCMMAKLALQGGKRIGEILSLTVDKIDWESNMITFKQSKTKGVICNTYITYPKSVMDSLREYIGNREGLVFLTKNGKGVPKNQLTKSFAKAGEKANISFKITPHVLRASCVTFLKQQGFSVSDIQKVTGHANPQMVDAYDKTNLADNVSKKVHLIN